MTSKENRSGRQQKHWPGPADSHLKFEANRNEKQQGQAEEDTTELIRVVSCQYGNTDVVSQAIAGRR